MERDSMISIVVPTVPGREEWLEKCLAGYKKTAPKAEVIVVRGEPTCAQAWEKGFEQSTGKYVHFTADDIVPLGAWWQDAITFLDKGIIPVADVVEDDKRFRCPTPMNVLKVMIPFLTRGMLNLGEWFLPIHHGSDDWITYRAVRLGFRVQFCPSYVVRHYIAPEGRVPERRAGDLAILENAMAEAGFVPHYYRWSVERNRRLKVS